MCPPCPPLPTLVVNSIINRNYYKLIYFYYIKVIEQLENKQSTLKEEIVNLKEQLSRALLDKEVLDQEKGHLADVLSKSEVQRAELELEIGKP